RCVDLVHHADIGMTYLERAFEFGRQRPPKSELRGLHADSLAALAIEGLVDDTHPALTHFADDFKSAADNLARLKVPVQGWAGDERFAKEVAHAFFPSGGFFHFAEQLQVAQAFFLNERLSFGRGPLEGSLEKVHYALVLVGAVFHCPTLKRSNSHFR